MSRAQGSRTHEVRAQLYEDGCHVILVQPPAQRLPPHLGNCRAAALLLLLPLLLRLHFMQGLPLGGRSACRLLGRCCWPSCALLLQGCMPSDAQVAGVLPRQPLVQGHGDGPGPQCCHCRPPHAVLRPWMAPNKPPALL